MRVCTVQNQVRLDGNTASYPERGIRHERIGIFLDSSDLPKNRGRDLRGQDKLMRQTRPVAWADPVAAE